MTAKGRGPLEALGEYRRVRIELFGDPGRDRIEFHAGALRSEFCDGLERLSRDLRELFSLQVVYQNTLRNRHPVMDSIARKAAK